MTRGLVGAWVLLHSAYFPANDLPAMQHATVTRTDIAQSFWHKFEQHLHTVSILYIPFFGHMLGLMCCKIKYQSTPCLMQVSDSMFVSERQDCESTNGLLT